MKLTNAIRFSSQLRIVGRVLDKNRKLLKELRHAGDVYKSSEKSYKWLKDQGYNFNYHTHIKPVEDGKLAMMCYEEGYVLESDGVQLFPFSTVFVSAT
jgi:hypothetical protein